MKAKIRYLMPLLVAAGCSHDGSSGPSSSVDSKISPKGLQALTGQTAIFETTRQMGQKSGNGNQMILSSGTLAGLSSGTLAETSGGTLSQLIGDTSNQTTVQTKSDKLSSRMNSSDCKVNVKIPDNATSNDSTATSSTGISPMVVDITGEACAAQAHLEINIAGSNGVNPCTDGQDTSTCNFTTEIKMQYQVLDQDLAAQMGVRSGHINMNIAIQQTMPGGNTQPDSAIGLAMKNSGSMDFKAVDLDGSAYLISGNQNVDIKMQFSTPTQNSQGSSMSTGQIAGGAQEDLKYSDGATGNEQKFHSSVVFNGQSQPQEQYTIDGVSVTRDVYQTERKKFENSMMNLSATAGPTTNSNSPTNPSNDPQPSPFPTPTPYPTPATVPTPDPQNPPQPDGDSKWICLDRGTADAYFVGYGSVKFIAQSQADQSCQASNDNEYCNSMACEQQDPNPQAWYCQTKDFSNGRIYSAYGASKVEAGYKAIEHCVQQNAEATECQMPSDADCTHK